MATGIDEQTHPHSPVPTKSSVSVLLSAHQGGDDGAFDRLIALLYQDLRRLAHAELARLQPWETLNTTGLVHEAYVKLVRCRDAGWRDRGHFLAASAKAMRHILVDAARRRLTAKNGQGATPVTLDERLIAEAGHACDVLAVDRALSDLKALDERMCRVVECRFFAGLSGDETAEALQVSVRTVHRDWLRAKGWLSRHLKDSRVAVASTSQIDNR